MAINALQEKYVIGIDYGTDSVRAILVNVRSGEELGQSVFEYPRWKKRLYCDPNKNQFRQHPRDYLEGLEYAILNVLQDQTSTVKDHIVGIGVDTTGSTPVAVDSTGTPLALQPQFEDNPNAMFVLWKDHTAIQEAKEINDLCQKNEIDYTKFCGGIYSSEWFWAKICHIVRADTEVAKAAHSWVEHCDWIPYHLTGSQDIQTMKRSRCAAGHKALWHPSWNGLPSESFLVELEPRLSGIRERLYDETFTSDHVAGYLSKAWSEKLGLRNQVAIAVGAFDAHMGAVGGQIEAFHLSKVMGTSTCDMLVIPQASGSEKLVAGICGQVNGSVIPGMLGLEAGQSAFGDVYAWFKKLICWPLEEILEEHTADSHLITHRILEDLIPRLSRAAALESANSKILALDWLNGRRTPDANQNLQGALMGLGLGSDAPKVFRALVESTCFGARAIVERFRQEQIPIKGLIGLGGVAKKSPFIMQVMADVMNMPIKIAKSEQTCALGAAMFAATAAKCFEDVEMAMAAMGSGFEKIYYPDQDDVAIYENKYQAYLNLGKAIEALT